MKIIDWLIPSLVGLGSTLFVVGLAWGIGSTFMTGATWWGWMMYAGVLVALMAACLFVGIGWWTEDMS